MTGVERLERATRDPEEAEGMLRALGAPARIEAAGRTRPGPFRFHTRLDRSPEISFARYEIEGDWSISTELDLFAVAVSDGAPLRWELGGVRGRTGEAPTLFGPGPAALQTRGRAEVLNIEFDRCELRRRAAEFYGVEQVVLAGRAPELHDARQIELWRSVVVYTRSFLRAGLLGEDLLRSALASNVVATLLSTFAPVTGRREWILRSGDALRVFRRAVAHLESHAAEPITVEGIAAHVETSVPMLDRAFREQTGADARHYLTAVRLAAAHADLVRADPEVRDDDRIAHRWGFASGRRLLALHRRMYPGVRIADAPLAATGRPQVREGQLPRSIS